MEEDIRGNQMNGWNDPKKNSKCIINIFCNDKKTNYVDDNKNSNDCHCTINIFCNDMKQGNNCDCRKTAGHCTINIFCADNEDDHQPTNEKSCC